MIVKETHTETLPCKLTTEELDDRRDQCARDLQEWQRLEDEKKSSAKRYASEISDVQDRLRLASREIRERSADRSVTVEVQLDMDAGKAFTVRTDTMVTVRERALTAEEKQQALFPPADLRSRGRKRRHADPD